MVRRLPNAQPTMPPVAPLDVESLLTPLSDDAPAGPDLGYEPDFAALEAAVAGKPERQYGDRIYPAELPDWDLVHEQALTLARRSRDLRLAVWLLRSGCHVDGFRGAAQGLQLVHGLLQRHWAAVHPQLDAADDDDPTMRLSALSALFVAEAFPTDLRAAALAPARGSLRVRDLELALGRADPGPGETVPTEAGATQALQALLQQHPQVAAQAQAALADATGLCQAMESRVGLELAPAPGPLLGPLQMLVEAIGRLQPAAQATAAASDAAAANPGVADDARAPFGTGAAPAGIRSRDDAVRELERVCHWIEQHEPSNPAPLLIRRAQRLMNMRFIEIIRDLAPDGLDQVTRLAGSDTAA